MLASGVGRPLSLGQTLSSASSLPAIPMHQQLLQGKPAVVPTLQQKPAAPSSRPSSAASRSGSIAEASALPERMPPPVQGSAAEGWKVSISFRGEQGIHGTSHTVFPSTCSGKINLKQWILIH